MSKLEELFKQREKIVVEMRQNPFCSPSEMMAYWDRLAPIENKIYELGGVV